MYQYLASENFETALSTAAVHTWFRVSSSTTRMDLLSTTALPVQSESAIRKLKYAYGNTGMWRLQTGDKRLATSRYEPLY